MAAPRAKSLDQVTCTVTLEGEEAQLFRQFLTDQGVAPSLAVKMMIASALYDDRKWWAAIRAERRYLAWEFRRAMQTEFVRMIGELKQSMQDELAMFDVQDPSTKGTTA